MYQYERKRAHSLSQDEISTILRHWEVPEWSGLTAGEFHETFERSEFYLLRDQDLRVLSLARLNFNFGIRIGGRVFKVAEFVGFVSVEKGKGYGTSLLRHIAADVQLRNIETIGFCEKNVRPFYEKCGIPIYQNKGRYLREKTSRGWVASADDDILDIHLSLDTAKAVKGLNMLTRGYIV
jgi:GNAT superfamily N-acetyltransferase